MREEILKRERHEREREKRKIIYITGGNQGAHVINETVKKCLPELLKKYKIIHQCGTVEYFGDYEKLKDFSHPRYRLAKWFDSKEVAEILGQADLVVSRAGANIISELAFLGKPAILIPLPSGSEQETNAKVLTEIGLAKILPQKKLTAKSLIQCITPLIQNLEEYKKKGKEAKKLVRIDASERLIAEVKKCLKADKKNIFS